MDIPQELIEKYQSEKSKRLNEAHLLQYVNLGDIPGFDFQSDLYAEKASLSSKKNPLADGSNIKFLVIGAGIQGLMMAQRLIIGASLDASDIVLVDKAGGFGGTWYWNRYPGVACDIESACYVPLLEETNYMPKHRYSYGQEIREQCERIASKWNIQGQFLTTVHKLRWCDASRRWLIEMTQESLETPERKQLLSVKAQFVAISTGFLKSPHAPKLNGVDHFCKSPGKVLMHTARWDWSLSGGSQQMPELTKFAGKRVGIVGTGATAIQVLPQVAKWAAKTVCFQRTAAYVDVQMQEEMTPENWASVATKKGWQIDRMESLDAMFTGTVGTKNLVQDSWTRVPAMRALVGGPDAANMNRASDLDEHRTKLLSLDYPWAKEMRSRVIEIVQDQATAKKLQAWHPGYCKRPAFHNTYLEVFNKPNVVLVDTNGEGIQKYTKNGVVANGQEYELDVLILATGYSTGFVDPAPSTLINALVFGENGRAMKHKWDSDDFGTLFGVMTSGFPNLFFATSSGAAASQNITALFSITTSLVADVIRKTMENATTPQNAVVSVEKWMEDAYCDEIASKAGYFSAIPTCTPGYFNGEGSVKGPEEQSADEREREARRSLWPEGILRYKDRIRQWTLAGMQGLIFDDGDASVTGDM